MKNLQIFFFFSVAIFIYLNTAGQPALVWTKTFGGSNSDEFVDISEVEDDGAIVIGNTYSIDGDLSGSYGGSDIWILKIDVNGNIIWNKRYGGSKDDYAAAILPTQDGGFVFAGWTYSNDHDVSGNHGSGYDIWIVKIDSIGNLLWQHCYGGSSGDRLGFAVGSYKGIIKTSDNGFLISGLSQSSDGDLTFHYGDPLLVDVWIFKIDSIGNIQWQRTIGGYNEEQSPCCALAADNQFLLAFGSNSIDGDLDTVVHYGNDDIILMKLDSLGNILKIISIGGSGNEFVNSMVRLSDSYYLLSGGSGSINAPFGIGFGGGNQIAIKFDSNFNINWVILYGGNGGEHPYSMLLAPNGNVLLLGKVYPDSVGGQITEFYGSEDYWCISIDSSDGHLIWEESFGGSLEDRGTALCLLASGELMLCGFTFSNDGQISDFKGITDGWIVQIDSYTSIGNLHQATSNSKVRIYPMPITSQAIVELKSDKDKIIHYTIYNFLGIKVADSTVPYSSKVIINTYGLARGCYSIDITTFSGAKYGKSIILQ